MNETEALDLLRERMIGHRSGAVAVTDVRYEYPINEYAEEYLRVVLVLSDPPGDQPTWPLDDVHELTRQGEEEVAKLQLTPPVFVAFTAQPEEWADDEDDAEVDA